MSPHKLLSLVWYYWRLAQLHHVRCPGSAPAETWCGPSTHPTHRCSSRRRNTTEHSSWRAACTASITSGEHLNSIYTTVSRAVTSVWERHQSLERLNYLSHLHITHMRNSTLDTSTSFCAFTVNEWLLHGMSLYQCFHNFPSFRLLVKDASSSVCTYSLNKLRNKTFCCEPEPKLNPSLISPIVSNTN